MNILVTGASGQLGRSLQDVSGGYDFNFVFTDVTAGDGVVELDATDAAAVDTIMRENKIDVVINCAGYTDVNKAEDEEDKAYVLNAGLPGILAAAAKEADALLMHISTDYIFDGKSSVPYREDDEPGPLGAYARTKLEGEKAVKQSGCRYMIFRTAWMYSSYGNNFMRTMESLTADRPYVNVVIDQTGTPTYAGDLAQAIMQIIENDMLDRVGTYNYTNEGVCTWYDFAKAVNRICGYTCDVRPCRSEDYPSKVTRPSYSVLDKSLFKKTFETEILHWEDVLEVAINEYLEKLNK